MLIQSQNLLKHLKFSMEEGKITLQGNRLLLFHADATGTLKQELVQTLGFDLARGVLSRFGFGCGYNDIFAMQHLLGFAPDDPELILAGPKMHTLEGFVFSSCQELEFDREAGTFYMTGTWHNSYEAEQHIRIFGTGTVPACWTLTGYASGYATGFMGKQIVAVEKKCLARGDEFCQYELRPAEEWGAEAKDYLEALQPITVIKSLQRLIQEEKKRALQWRALNEAAVEVFQLGNFDEVIGKFLRYVAMLAEADQILLLIRANRDFQDQYLLYKTTYLNEATFCESLITVEGTLSSLFNIGRATEGDGRSWQGPQLFPKGKVGRYLAVPVREIGGAKGVLIAGDPLHPKGFSPEDKEFLTIFASQLSIVLDNVTLFTSMDFKLQKKMTQLNALSQELRQQNHSLQRSMAIHEELTALVLNSQGWEAIARTLARIIDNPVRIEDAEKGELLAEAVPAGKFFQADFLSVQYFLAGLEAGKRATFAQGKLQRIPLSGIRQPDQAVNQLVWPVVASGEILGYINVLEVFHPATDLDVVAVEHAGTVVALEFLKKKIAQETEQRLKNDFLDQLLAGKFISEEAMVAQARTFGFDLTQPWRVFLFELAGPNHEELRKGQERLSALLRQELPGSLVTVQEQAIIVLSRVQGEAAAGQLVKELEAKAAGLLREYQWWLAVGPEGKSARDCPHSYREAQEVMKVLKAFNNRKHFLVYEDLTVFSLLQIDRERFARFSKQVLGPLLDYDARYNSQFLETLRLYFDCQGNVQKAAKESFLNPGTIRYRLRRIQEISGLNLRDPGVSLQLQLALKIIL